MSFAEIDIYRGVAGRLAGDATLAGLLGDGAAGVVRQPAPASITYPMVTLQLLPTSDVAMVGDLRYMHRAMLVVQAWASGNNLPSLEPVAERIDALLQNHQSTTGSTTMELGRLTVEPRDLVEAGQRFVAIASTYQVTFYQS